MIHCWSLVFTLSLKIAVRIWINETISYLTELRGKPLGILHSLYRTLFPDYYISYRRCIAYRSICAHSHFNLRFFTATQYFNCCFEAGVSFGSVIWFKWRRMLRRDEYMMRGSVEGPLYVLEGPNRGSPVINWCEAPVRMCCGRLKSVNRVVMPH